MTTLAQLKKYAKAYFTPELQKRGFTIGPKRPIYWRRIEDDIYHMMWLDLDRAHEQVRVMVHAWVPEGQPNYDGRFPDGAGMFAGNYLDPRGLDISAFYWDVQDEARAQASFKDILAVIDAIALPWFDRVKTRQDLIKVIRPDMMSAANLILGKAKPKTSA